MLLIFIIGRNFATGGVKATVEEFRDKLVVLTGARGGLGRALSAALVGAGARVVGCDLPDNSSDSDEFAHFCAFDLADAASADAAADAILTQHGSPDILINNAGWTRAETLAQLDGDAIGRELDLNLGGVMRFTTPVARAMANRGAGVVVSISSVNALAHFGNAAYAAAKAGLNAYSRAIAVEYGRSGVRSNVVCPGSIRTHAWDHRLEKDPTIMDRLQRLYPLGRIVNPGEVTEAVLFLASARASGITGVVLPVDAGLSAGCLPFIDDILGS